jgi:diguanylate cyclase (GGDEF)-like protein/PAS domain S-box-containing protein
LLLPRGRWLHWIVAAGLGQALARLASGDSWIMCVGLGAANLFEAWMVAAWIRRGVEDVRHASSLGQLARDALSSTLVACALSATFAVAVLGASAHAELAINWIVWFMAHMLGMVIVATLVVCIAQPSVRLSGEPGRRLDYFAGIGLMLLTCMLIFLQVRYPILFLGYLPLLLLAFRYGLSGMVAGSFALAAISGWAALTDNGPFALMEGTPLARTLLWQAYVAAGCLLAYATSVAVTERARLIKRLTRSEAQFLSLAEHMPAMVARFDRDVRYTYANARSRNMAPGVELVGLSLRELRGEKAYAEILGYVDGVLAGEAQTFDSRRRLAGKDVDLHVQFVPELAADGAVQGFYSLAFDITEQKHTQRELERLARFDPLTGLANRREFDERLDAAVTRARRTDAGLLLLSLDIDYFKQINDSYGHAIGDEVLAGFAARLRSAVYDVDLVARPGGDEFQVLVQYTPTAEVGMLIAARVLEAMRPPLAVTGLELQISTSIGIGVHQPAHSAKRLLALADQALYEAKAKGRNTWSLCAR